MEYAKAIAAAITVLVVFAVAQFGLELPPVVTGALETLITGGVVWAVKNKPKETVNAG